MDSGQTKSGQKGKARGVNSLATEVLSVVAKNSQLGETVRWSMLVDKFCDVVRAFEPDALVSFMAELRAIGVSNDEIAETLIPAAARKLGDRWCTDHLGFADVTIGSARLQSILRDLSTTGDVKIVRDDTAPAIAIAVRADEHHTLGALVLAYHYRRQGIAVRVLLGRSDEEIAEVVQGGDFGALFISASGGVKLESLRNLVNLVQNGLHAAPPIVVGGSLLESRKNAKTLTGADYATNDPAKALRLCGLTVPERTAPLVQV